MIVYLFEITTLTSDKICGTLELPWEINSSSQATLNQKNVIKLSRLEHGIVFLLFIYVLFFNL